MNKSDISEEKLIALSLTLLRETGSGDLNMRQLAKAAGTAVGSIYNYFPTKGDLVLALIERVWNGAFRGGITLPDKERGFPAYVAAVYKEVYAAQKDYHNFFMTHRTLMVGGEKAKGRDTMGRYIAGLHAAFLQQLQADSKVRPGLWAPDFTPQQLVAFTFSGMLSSLSRDESSCAYLCRVLEKLLYL